MGLRINTNVASLIAQERLRKTTDDLRSTSQKLSTGWRIVNGKDDAAGLAISENMRANIRATQQNLRNAQDGFYLLQTADGALNEVTQILIRMKELAIQASSESSGARERGLLRTEYELLKREVDRIANATIYNEQPLLNGEGENVVVQVGPNNAGDLDRIEVTKGFDITADALGLEGVSIDGVTDARASLDLLDEALAGVSKMRGSIGAGESRLSSTMNSLMHYKENIIGAYSQIRDADLAVETSNYAKHNILSQAGVSVLAQANSAPEAALRLLN